MTAYDVVEQRDGHHMLVHLYLQTVSGMRIRFYTGDAPFDIALLLDELEASLGDKPRTWKKAEPTAVASPSVAHQKVDGQ